MGTAADGGKGFKERAAVSGERPIGAARCRQQHNQASCPPPPLPPHSCPQARRGLAAAVNAVRASGEVKTAPLRSWSSREALRGGRVLALRTED